MIRDKDNNYVLDKIDIEALSKNMSGNRKRLTIMQHNFMESYRLMNQVLLDISTNFLGTVARMIELNVPEQIQEQVRKEAKELDQDIRQSLKELRTHIEWAEGMSDLMDYVVKKEVVTLVNEDSETYWQDIFLNSFTVSSECSEEIMEQILADNRKFDSFMERMTARSYEILEAAQNTPYEERKS